MDPHQLIDREQEREVLRDLLQEKRRVIVIKAAAGMGKTAFAQAGPVLLRQQLPGGTSVIRGSGLAESLGSQGVPALLSHMRGDLDFNLPCLLVVDGMDEIADAALRQLAVSLLQRLLDEVPNLRILMTSRDDVSFPGASTFQLSELPEPDVVGWAQQLLRRRPRGVSSQASELRERKIGITPFDCPWGVRSRSWP